MDFLTLIKEKMKLVELDQKFLSRAVNEGFSGGEKKRNEIFQMAVLNQSLQFLMKQIQDLILMLYELLQME